MKFTYEVKIVPTRYRRRLQRLLPCNFQYKAAEGKGQLAVNLSGATSKDWPDQIVQRECDLFSFLTSHGFSPERQWWTSDVGVSVRQLKHTEWPTWFPSEFHKKDHMIVGQKWEDPILATQLRLWNLAWENWDKPVLHILLLNQVIELDSSAKLAREPKCESRSPNFTAREEAKLLRDLCSHQGRIGNPRLKNYCQQHHLPESFPTPDDESAWSTIKKRIPVIARFVHSMIEQKLTRTYCTTLRKTIMKQAM